MNLEIIREMIRLGTEQNGSLADPSKSELLKKSGVAAVTAHIEKLSLFSLIKDAQPIFGENGGMWIGFSLSEKGLECGKSPALLEEILSEIGGKPIDQVSNSVYDLIEICKTKHVNPNYKDDFIKTLEEIVVCFENKYYTATVTLCGKILEILLLDILYKNNIEIPNNAMIGKLIKKVRESLPYHCADGSLENIANIIAKSRNSAAHFNGDTSSMSRDQAVMVIFATKHFVNRNL